MFPVKFPILPTLGNLVVETKLRFPEPKLHNITLNKDIILMTGQLGKIFLYKSECRVWVFVESGFSTGPIPGLVFITVKCKLAEVISSLAQCQ